MKPLLPITALIFLTLALIASATTVSASTGADLLQPATSCSSTRSSVTFTWRPVPGSTAQWLDVSTEDNGFAPGTFETEGPIEGSTTSHVWDGLKSGTPYFWRVNASTAEGWQSSQTASFTPCADTATGVRYVFGTNVSQADQNAVREAIRISTDYGKQVLGFEPSAYTVHAFQDVGELADVYARWVEDPSPDTIFRIRRSFGPGLAGLVSYGDGMFIPTWNASWTRSATYRYLVIGHEYFHIVQAALRETSERRGTPLWLSEGSAELFGVLVYCRKTGADYNTIRNNYIRETDGLTETLVAFETGGRFSQTANESYPLAMLAFEYLIKETGWQGIIDYYRAIGRNQHWQAAFTQSFDTPYDAFARSFDEYRQRGYR
jgi:hypothetical protein